MIGLALCNSMLQIIYWADVDIGGLRPGDTVDQSLDGNLLFTYLQLRSLPAPRPPPLVEAWKVGRGRDVRNRVVTYDWSGV